MVAVLVAVVVVAMLVRVLLVEVAMRVQLLIIVVVAIIEAVGHHLHLALEAMPTVAVAVEAAVEDILNIVANSNNTRTSSSETGILILV
jgi:hypothetical protein